MSGYSLSSLSADSAAWQDYRSANTGMVVFYAGDPISELPIREVPEEMPSEIPPDPHYETGTYGFYGCGKSKIRAAFVKSKIRYLLFVTKYAGTDVEFKDKLAITGYYKIAKTAEVKKIHIRYGTDYSCLNEQNCYALRADESRFVAMKDAFAVTEEVLKTWDYNARMTKQTRILLDEQRTKEIIDHLKSKPDITPEYIAETKRLQPHADEVSEEEA
jgi:hypothetical protein